MPYREEYTNTVVAKVLKRLLGIEVKAEGSGRKDRRLLDFQISKHNLVLEAKYNNFPAAVQAAQNRWTNMHPPPDVVGAVSYHADFAKDPEQAIGDDKPIEFALSGNRHADLAAGKRTGTVYDLAQSLRRPAAIINPNEDEVEQAVNKISAALGLFWGMINTDKGTLVKMAGVLQASFDGNKEEKVLEQSARVGGLILLGALLFQMALARADKRVNRPSENIVELREHWRFILNEINYAAIFSVAERLLDKCGIEPAAVRILKKTAEKLEEPARDGLDLMGRIYHQLLADAKPLGAFYTSIPAATLMAGLALNAEDWGKDKEWAEMDFIKKFRIADPACGSGTLLAAACWQMRDNFSRADAKIKGIVWGGEETEHPIKLVQKTLLEEVVWGYDILETAGHLTATTLGLMSPDVDFRKAHIYRTIIGETTQGVAAGSLEMLEGMPIFTRTKQIEGTKHVEAPPELDLCIMNPPFVRGTIGNESFSFLSGKEQQAVHEKIRQLGKRHHFSCDKGLGPAFVALACQQRSRDFRIKDGGRIAVILPATFAIGMGRAWSGARNTIRKNFDLEILIVSREDGHPNFSENTALQECIAIIRKRKKKEKPQKNAFFVVLSKNPKTADEAQATARAIIEARKNGENIGDLRMDSATRRGIKKHIAGNIGQYAVFPWYDKNAWHGVSFANLYLSLVAETFASKGKLTPLIPQGKVKLKRLQELASIGSHCMDLFLNARIIKNRRCRISPTPTEYAGYYPGHHKEKTGISQRDLRNIAEEPQCYWLPLPKHEEWAENFYAKAGRIVICQSFRFNTMRRLAVLVSKPVQASHYWPIKLHNETEQKLKAMTLWLNSTPSLLLIATAAQSTFGAKVGFSQKAAMELPVLDIESLTPPQLRKLSKVFDKIAESDGFLPLPYLTHDDNRKKIDDVFSEICGLSDLAPLREALAIEPIITDKPAGVVLK